MTIFEALGSVFGMIGETAAAGESFAKGLHSVADVFSSNAERMAQNWFSDDDDDDDESVNQPVKPKKPAPKKRARASATA
jgi:hypothetical protein